MQTVIDDKISKQEKTQIAVIPDSVLDPLRGWTLTIKKHVIDEIRGHGCVPLIVPIHDQDGNIDAAAHSYIRRAFDFKSILASEDLKSEMDSKWSLEAVQDYTEKVVKSRRETAISSDQDMLAQAGDTDITHYFNPRVMVVPDLKGEDIRVSRRFVDALRIGSRVIPVLSSCAENLAEEMYYAEASGILIPGSCSNYHPKHYGGVYDSLDDMCGLENLYDMDRDRLVQAAVELAFNEDIPLFGICSGMQGIALFCPDNKGKLLPDLKAVGRHGHSDSVGGAAAKEGFHAARAPVFMPSGYRLMGEGVNPKMFNAAHVVHLLPGSFLTHLMSLTLKYKAADQNPINSGFKISVNSLHQQAVDENSLGCGLVVNAVAEDGTIEALHAPAKKYVVGVQFHPEAAFMDGVKSNDMEDKLYRALFWSFGQAVGDKLWREIIGRRGRTGNWRNRGMPRVYMTVMGSIRRTPEFVTNGGLNGTLLNLVPKPDGFFIGG